MWPGAGDWPPNARGRIAELHNDTGDAEGAALVADPRASEGPRRDQSMNVAGDVLDGRARSWARSFAAPRAASGYAGRAGGAGRETRINSAVTHRSAALHWQHSRLPGGNRASSCWSTGALIDFETLPGTNCPDVGGQIRTIRLF